MRPCRTIHVAQRMAPLFERRVALAITADGCAALYRDKDGNAYEITVKPACLSDASRFGAYTTGAKRERKDAARAARFAKERMA